MVTVRCPNCQGTIRLYDTSEAAAYLGLSVAGVKYHVHIAKTIEPVLIGRTLVFTCGELDAFQARRRPQGRPLSE